MHNIQESVEKAAIILRYLRNELDTSQELELKKWLDEDPLNRAFFEKISNEEGLKEELSFFKSTDKAAAWEEFESKIEPYEHPTLWARMPLLKYISVAAALMVIGFSFFYLQQQEPGQVQQFVHKNDVKPGYNKASLILADGHQILLEDAANGQLAQHKNIVISKNATGQLVFNMKNAVDSKYAQQEMNSGAYHTLSTPKGGDYMLILPDGSKIWLNAASTLRIPVSFSAKERKIELTGEAYFEVSKNKSAPFKVIVGDAEVKVLGTRFNIMAYADEKSIKTTLLEGSVKVSKHKNEVILKPGEQATIKDDIEIGPANLEAVAWKDGFTSFKDADIETIMRAVSRWYDIEVHYKGKLTNRLFTGSVARGANLSEVLNSLQYLGGIQFKIEGRIVTISK